MGTPKNLGEKRELYPRLYPRFTFDTPKKYRRLKSQDTLPTVQQSTFSWLLRNLQPPQFWGGNRHHNFVLTVKSATFPRLKTITPKMGFLKNSVNLSGMVRAMPFRLTHTIGLQDGSDLNHPQIEAGRGYLQWNQRAQNWAGGHYRV